MIQTGLDADKVDASGLIENDTTRVSCCVHPQVFLYFAEKEDVLTRFFDGEHACAETSMILTTGQESERGARPLTRRSLSLLMSAPPHKACGCALCPYGGWCTACSRSAMRSSAPGCQCEWASQGSVSGLPEACTAGG